MVAVSYSMMRQRGVHWIGNLRVHDTAAVAGGEGVALAAARVARPHGRGGAQACNVQKAPAAPLFGTGAWAPAVLHIRAFHREFRSHPSFILSTVSVTAAACAVEPVHDSILSHARRCGNGASAHASLTWRWGSVRLRNAHKCGRQ